MPSASYQPGRSGPISSHRYFPSKSGDRTREQLLPEGQMAPIEWVRGFRTGWLLLAAVLPSTPIALRAQNAAEADSAEAHRAALAWLALVDSGLYAASLDSAAPLLRQLITSPEQWAGFLATSREGFTTLRRELLIAELDPSLPVVPPGRYIRLTFRITGRKSEATESVVLQAQPSGWRVAMYGVQTNS
jgi:hypothetical protein